MQHCSEHKMKHSFPPHPIPLSGKWLDGANKSKICFRDSDQGLWNRDEIYNPLLFCNCFYTRVEYRRTTLQATPLPSSPPTPVNCGWALSSLASIIQCLLISLVIIVRINWVDNQPCRCMSTALISAPSLPTRFPKTHGFVGPPQVYHLNVLLLEGSGCWQNASTPGICIISSPVGKISSLSISFHSLSNLASHASLTHLVRFCHNILVLIRQRWWVGCLGGCGTGMEMENENGPMEKEEQGYCVGTNRKRRDGRNGVSRANGKEI